MFTQLQEIRKKQEATCEDMAKILGLKAKSTYQKKETGKIPFTLGEAKKISDYFKLSIETIFFGK